MMGTKVNVDHEIEVELESHELAAVRRLRYLDDIMTDVLDSARAAGHRLASETVAGSGRLRAPRGTPLIEKRGLRCCRAGASPAYDIRCDPRCSRTRAEGTRLTGRATGRVNPCALPSDTYSDDGNLLTKSGLTGTYTYQPLHPHAVRTAGSNHFDYDAKGNQIWGDDGSTARQISYSAFDKPNTIWRGGAAASFAYDADQNRLFKSFDNGNAATTDTVYIDDLFEKVTSCNADDGCYQPIDGYVDYKYFVHSPERVVAVVTKHTRTGWADVTRSHTKYLHSDHLGSVDVVTDP